MLLNPRYNIGLGAPPSSAVNFNVTVAAGKVSADLVDFPLMIDLSHMPSSFWTAVRSDGGNIRVYASDGISPIPFDLTYINKTRNLGRLYAKTTLLSASSNTIVVSVLDTSFTGLPVTDTYGRNAVWSDYEVVWVFPETVNRTGNSFSQTMTGIGYQTEWKRSDYQSVLPGAPHQGVTVDGSGKLWTVDDGGLRRHTVYDVRTVLALNSTFLADFRTLTGDTLVNHSSAACVIGTELWVPLNEYPNTGGSFNEYLVVFDYLTLAYKRHYDVSAVGRHVSAIVYNPADSTIYATDYLNGASLMKFDTSGTYLGTVTLSSSITQLQGITIVDGKFVLSSNTSDDVWECNFDGTGVTLLFRKSEGGVPEGLSYDGVSKLYYLDGDGDLMVYERVASLVDWARLHYACAFTRLPRSVVSSMAVSVHWLVTSGDLQQAFIALENDTTAASTGSTTVTNILYDEGPDLIGLWNSTDSWLYSDNNPEYRNNFRISAKHNNTTERKLFVNGNLEATDATISARPSGGGTDMEFIIGASNRFSNNEGEAYYQYAWLRNDYVSDAWLEADGVNNRYPQSFYAISGVTFTDDELIQAYLAKTRGFAFDFTDITRMWTVSTRTALLSTTSDPVGAIQNKWSGGVTSQALQATAGSRPVWNGSNALDFSGTQHLTLEGNFASFLNARPACFFSARILVDSLSAQRPIIAISSGTGTTARFTLIVKTNGALELTCRNSDTGTVTVLTTAAGEIVAGTAYVITAYADFAGTRDVVIRKNGSVIGSTTLVQSAANTQASNSNRFWIGRNNVTTTEYFDGRMGQFMFISDAIPNSTNLGLIEAKVGEGTLT